MTDVDLFLRRLFAMDSTLAAHGVPALSRGWKIAIIDWIRGGKRRLVIRKGRRAGGSLTLAKLAIAFALYAGVQVPVGDTAWCVFVSVTKAEALARLSTIEDFLRILGVEFERSGDRLRLAGLPLGFVVLACDHRSTVGITAFLAVGDEVASWSADGMNPARRVWTQISPMLATIAQGREIISSTPLSKLDFHYELCEMGCTEQQHFVHGCTWDFNPTLTREACRSFALSEEDFKRSYEAIALDAESAAFDAAAVDRAFRAPEADMQPGARFLVIDASSGKGDRWSYGIASWQSNFSDRYVRKPDGSIRTWGYQGEWMENRNWKPKKPVLVFELLNSFDGKFFDMISGDEILDKIAATARSRGAARAYADQRESLIVSSGLQRRGIKFYECAWTAQTKPQAVEIARRWFADNLIILPQHERMRKELLAFEQAWTPSGRPTYEGRGMGDDFVALILTLAIADVKYGLPYSAFQTGSVYGTITTPRGA